MKPRALILGSSGPALTDDERRFFRDADPLGFILFRRNCQSPDQVRDLVSEMRETVGRAEAPVLIDQEGGRIQRLRPPHWRAYPPGAFFGDLAATDMARAETAARLNARLIAADLADTGIDVDCLPVLDVPMPGADDVIGDRALGTDPDVIAHLGRALCEGLIAGGVLPVIKHIPGHGRATADSHKALPRVDATREALSKTDFRPFHALRDMPWAMTAHVLYEALDDAHPATLSAVVVQDIVRGAIGFQGLLLTDDISMGALSGTLAERARGSLEAGCDVVLHCNGDWAEMEEVAGATDEMSDAAMRRFEQGRARLGAAAPFDRGEAAAELDRLIAPARASRWT